MVGTMIRNSRDADALRAVWAALEGLVADASVEGLVAHKLGPFAAVAYKSGLRPVPAELEAEFRAATFASLSATALLRRIVEIAPGRILLLKGPEVAARYPSGGRRFGDVDVLAADAEALHSALRAAGFVEVEDGLLDRSEHHHLTPLRGPTSPLVVEVHGTVNWPASLEAPRVEALFEAALPSETGIPGLDAPSPQHHALLLAAHGWRHEPLQSLRDLADVALMSATEDDEDLLRQAAAWGLRRNWETTRRAADSALFGAPRTWPLRTWARHLPAVRERTVLEVHLQRIVSPYWGLPPAAATVAAARGLATTLTPVEDESWREKARRIPRAVREAGVGLSKRGH
jgi:hypothetical protein